MQRVATCVIAVVALGAAEARAGVDHCGDVQFQGARQRTRTRWRACGPGCLELAPEAVGVAHRVYASSGATHGRAAHLAYTVEVGNRRELRIIRLPGGEPELSATMGTTGDGCSIHLRALGSGQAVLESLSPVTPDRPRPWGLWSVDLTRPRARPVRRRVDALRAGGFESAVSDRLWITTLDRRELSWQSRPGRGRPAREPAAGPGWISGLIAAGDRAFYTLADGDAASLWMFRPGSGQREIAPQACCATSDGRQLVWLERGPGGLDLVAAPIEHAAPEQLVPRRLRRLAGDRLATGGAAAGGGFALHLEVGRDGRDERLVLTRLSDGAHREIPPRPGRRWGRPLYLTRTEMAAVEHPAKETPAAAAIGPASAVTVVRRTLASLGRLTP